MKRNLVVFTLMIAGTTLAETDHKAMKQNYIDQYRTTAIQQMIHNKIPASITLAQGIIESGAGTSLLATQGNNHFGIKCHDWKGDRMYHDDDAKGECFRVYGNADLSYVDHSQFLLTRERYSFLFGLNTTDYEGWARGLKKAGYATNPQYAEILIKIIEDYNLDDFDAAILPPQKKNDFLNAPKNKFGQFSKVDSKSNESAYVIASEGDTYYRISQEFSMALWELHKYNDFSKTKDVIEPGDKIYLEPKKNKIDGKNAIKITQQNQTLLMISQELGIKMKKLEKLNPEIKPEEILTKGTQILLD